MKRLLLILAAAAALCALAPAPDATADDDPTVQTHEAPTATAPAPDDQVDAREQLALARVCVSEVGWDPTPECAAIHQVLEDRAQRMGMTYGAAVCAYSSRTCDRDRTDARRWISHLTARGARPDGWPSTASWARHRPRWLELHEHAGEVLRGRVASSCDGEVHHWGMPGGIDLERALSAGWTRVDCPGARNAFWRVSSRASS